MSIRFEVRASLETIDTPLINLRNKKFDKVALLCFDDEILRFTCNEQDYIDCKDLCRHCVYGEDIIIEIHSEHLTWIDRGKLNILPYSSILRWVIE